jgi:hypothetical protein
VLLEKFTLLNKGNNHKEEKTNVNRYAPNIGTPNFINPTLVDLKAPIDQNTKIVGD